MSDVSDRVEADTTAIAVMGVGCLHAAQDLRRGPAMSTRTPLVVNSDVTDVVSARVEEMLAGVARAETGFVAALGSQARFLISVAGAGRG